ncbi:2-oxoacid:acceptor oxidoreductase family protein [bacterium]|nr:2-oxoacid:acceptor oxidoreductase family protein [bacterium]
MEGISEVRWHGRGGQGTVTAAKIFAETATSGGKYVQAFPEYGPERMGAPLRAYNRISEEPLYMHCQVINPDIVAVVDPALMKTVDITEGTNEEAVFLINTTKTPAEIRNWLGLKGGRIFTVDATKISLETLGNPIPNTPMLGAMARVSGLISLDHLIEQLKINFGKKFAQDMIDKNIQAIKRAYQEVREE